MTPIVLFVVGAPGVGKTTLVRGLLDKLDSFGQRYTVPSPKWTIVPGTLTLAGHYTGSTFDGADTVPYNGVVPALNAWATREELHGNPLTILDGDRFSNESPLRFFDRSSVEGQSRGGPDVRVCIAHLRAPEDAIEERRRARGSKQNPSWIAGRVTKARRFAEAYWNGDGRVVHVDAGAPAPTILRDFIRQLDRWGFPDF